jgi:hypothetical protein
MVESFKWTEKNIQRASIRMRGYSYPLDFAGGWVSNPATGVSLRLEQGEVRIATLRRRLAKAQRIVRKHVPRSVSLVDELIAERRE